MSATADQLWPAGGDPAAAYQAVRRRTLALTAALTPEDMVVQTMPDVSPTKWHLAHTSWFFENFLLAPRLPGYRVFHESYAYLFNSYYFQVGRMHPRPERGLLSRPTVAEIRDYRAHVDAAMARLLAERGTEPEIAALTTLGLHHEQQHQELLLTDIKHVLSCNPLQPALTGLPADPPRPAPEPEFLPGPDGVQAIGHAGSGFAYDNEGPRHEVLLRPYAIANRPVTNGEFREFIRAGGYRRPELWLSDGWTLIQREGRGRPWYWSADLESEFTLGGPRAINPQAPVCHLSYYEADAFATWAGCRLPSEAEWEAWARELPLRGHCQESGHWHPLPAAGEGPAFQVFGDVWEWTRSAYQAYPGYTPPPGAVGEYNGKFMCGQQVLRGGSCVTPLSHLRVTYRNFFYPDARWQFTGVRLAKDL